REVSDTVQQCIGSEMFVKNYAGIFDGDERWQKLKVPEGTTYKWATDSSYIKRAPYFDGMGRQPSVIEDIHGARVLAKLGDSITTDHISPAGSIKPNSPAGKYLVEHGVDPK